MTRIRSAGRWCLLLGILGALFAVSVEGRVGPVTLVALAVAGGGLVVAVVVPALYGTGPDGAPRVSRTVRVGVPVVAAITALVGGAAIAEGGVGPVTTGLLAVLLVGATARVVVPVLYGTGDDGTARFSRSLRLGVPVAVAAAVVVGLGAALVLRDGSSADTVAVRSGNGGDQGAGNPAERDAVAHVEHPPPSTEPPPEPVVLPQPAPAPVVIPVIGKWNTVGNPFADPTCADGGPLGGDHGPGPVTKVPLDAPTQGAVDGQLDAAQVFALRFPTVAHAEFAGYRRATADLPCIGAHYVKWDITAGEWGIVDGQFAPATPEILLYDGTSPSSPLVGVSYLMVSVGKPDGFVGPNDDWHRHRWLCLTDGVVSGVGVPADACAGPTQRWLAGHDLWMAHAWVVPGYDNALGVFADGHGKLA